MHAKFPTRLTLVGLLLLCVVSLNDVSAQTQSDRFDSLFIAEPRPEAFDAPASASFIKINDQFFRTWELDDTKPFELDLPLTDGRSVRVRLQSFPVLTRDAQIVLATEHGEEPFTPMKHAFLRGEIVGEPGSHVYLALFGTYGAGYIEREEAGVRRTYLVSPIGHDIYSPQTLIVYDNTGKQSPPWACGMEEAEMIRGPHQPKDTPSGPHSKGARIQSTTPMAITQALELSNNFYTERGSSDANKTTNYALLVTGGESDIYKRDLNTSVRVTYVRIWTATDPYTGTSSSAQLNQFRDHWNANQRSVTRNVAHLYSATNYGGIAFLDVLCASVINGYGYAWSGMLGGYVYPSDGFYWDPFVISHELGHNIGSPHTQSCNYNPPIDSCVVAEQGTCYTSSQLRQITGTIMSYCNTRTLNFHPRSSAWLRAYVEAASCATSVSMPIAKAGPDVSICSGDIGTTIGETASGGTSPLQYWWRPATGLSDTAVARPTANPTSNRQYIVRVTDNNGLRTYDTVNVTVHPAIFHTPAVDKFTCVGTGVQIGNAATGLGSPFAYTWTPTTGLSEANIASPIASPSVTTTYYLTVTDQNTCVKRDTVTVTVRTPPSIALSASSPVCSGTGVLIGAEATGTGPFTYSWSPSIGLTSTNIAMPTASPATTTKYYLTVTDANGCQKRDSTTVTIAPLLVASAGEDVMTCEGTKVTLGKPITGGTPPYTIRWSPKFGLSDTTVATPTITAASSQLYVLSVTDAQGCSTRDSVLFIVSAELDLALENASTCKGSAVAIGAPAINGIAPYRYEWTPSTGLSSTVAATPLAKPDVSTTYYVTVTDIAGCTTSDSVRVVVGDAVSVSLGADKNVCIGTSAKLAPLTSLSATATYAWRDLTKGVVVSNAKELTIAPTADAKYELTVTDGNCSGRDTIQVKLVARPTAAISGKHTFCVSDSTTLSISEGFSSYLWSDGRTSSSIMVREPGEYWCAFTNADGCSDTARVSVTHYASPSTTIAISGDTLFAAEAASYQWYRNNEPISGARTRSYIVLATGSYHAELTSEMGCNVTSEAVQKTVARIHDLTNAKLRIVPNPTRGLVLVKALFPETVKRVYVTTMLGTEIAIDAIRELTSTNEFELDLRDLPSGSYLLHVVTESNEYVEKLIKQ